MATERSILWAGWRQKYLSGDSMQTVDGLSVFTDILRSGRPDDETLIVRHFDEVVALMNLHPYSPGHLMVVPRRQIEHLDQLSPTESTQLWSATTQAVSVIRRIIGAPGVNVGLNLGPASGGSVPNHLHVHVVPRWLGDVNFLGSTAETRVIPEAIDVTADRVRRGWIDLHGSV